MTSCGGRGRWGRLAERLVLAAFLVFVWLGFGLRVRAWVAVLAWPGLARLGLVWPGLAWSGPAWLGLARLGLAGAGAPAGAAWPRGVLPAPRRLRGPATRDCPRSLRNQRAPPGSGCPATARAPSRRSGNPLFLVRLALHRQAARAPAPMPHRPLASLCDRDTLADDGGAAAGRGPEKDSTIFATNCPKIDSA